MADQEADQEHANEAAAEEVAPSNTPPAQDEPAGAAAGGAESAATAETTPQDLVSVADDQSIRTDQLFEGSIVSSHDEDVFEGPQGPPGEGIESRRTDEEPIEGKPVVEDDSVKKEEDAIVADVVKEGEVEEMKEGEVEEKKESEVEEKKEGGEETTEVEEEKKPAVEEETDELELGFAEIVEDVEERGIEDYEGELAEYDEIQLREGLEIYEVGEEELLEEEGTDAEGVAVLEKTLRKHKKKNFRRRKSITYELTPRHIDENAQPRKVSGDFVPLEASLTGMVTIASVVHFERFGEEEEEEESIKEEEKPHKEPINRSEYYELYKTLFHEKGERKLKNNFLQKKMVDYFKKRRMEHVFKESDQQVDTEQRYHRMLGALGELKEHDNREKNSILCELNDLREERDEQIAQLNSDFNAMQNWEKETGTGLINSKTGKEMPEKMIDQLLKRQRTKWEQVGEMRLEYIKIRNQVSEKQSALKELDRIGDNYHLIDYEQLKVENQNLTDKIEERDEDLTRLRIKCSGAIQCLAHIREKSADAQLDIIETSSRLNEIEQEFMECRETLNYFKQQRDYYRQQTAKLKKESGLLTKPQLLNDMQNSMNEIEATVKELSTLQAEHVKLKESLEAIKQNVEIAPTRVITIKQASVDDKSKKQRLYKGRPTLVLPTLPESEFGDI